MGLDSLKIHKGIRRASFVPLEEGNPERLKYKLNLLRSKYISDKLIELKRIKNTVVQKVKIWFQKWNWKKMSLDTSVWLIEAGIEGTTANFATHYLFGLPLNPATILAHGIAIKQGIEIYWRLKRDGENRKLPTKD